MLDPASCGIRTAYNRMAVEQMHGRHEANIDFKAS